MSRVVCLGDRAMPWTRIMTTGGVSPAKELIQKWIQAEDMCLGMGSKRIDEALVLRRTGAVLAGK